MNEIKVTENGFEFKITVKPDGKQLLFEFTIVDLQSQIEVGEFTDIQPKDITLEKFIKEECELLDELDNFGIYMGIEIESVEDVNELVDRLRELTKTAESIQRVSNFYGGGEVEVYASEGDVNAYIDITRIWDAFKELIS